MPAVLPAAPSTAPSTTPRRFRLHRRKDLTGVSGTGTVAWGTVYPNGKVSLAWCGPRPSINVYESLDDVEAIHGHDGLTEVIMYDGVPQQATSASGSVPADPPTGTSGPSPAGSSEVVW